MLLSNTATTAMMVQIVKVILAELELGEQRQNEENSRNNHGSLQQDGSASLETWSERETQNEISLAYNEEQTDVHSCRTDTTNNRDVLKEYARSGFFSCFHGLNQVAID